MNSENLDKLYIPRYCTKRMQKSIRYLGVKIWNDTPFEIQNLPKQWFKMKLQIFCPILFLKSIFCFFSIVRLYHFSVHLGNCLTWGTKTYFFFCSSIFNNSNFFKTNWATHVRYTICIKLNNIFLVLHITAYYNWNLRLSYSKIH